MHKKNITSGIFAICFAAVLLTSCSQNGENVKPNTTVNSSQQTASDSSDANGTPDDDNNDGGNNAANGNNQDNNQHIVDNGNAVSTEEQKSDAPLFYDTQAVEVTDAGGAAVTNADQVPVTQIVTVPSKISTEFNAQKAGLWIADVSPEKKFLNITEDNALVKLTVKINESAANGDYGISLSSPTSRDKASNFADSKDGIPVTLDNAVISVGGEARPDNKDSSGLVFSLTNASANPGDTVTLYGNLHNVASTKEGITGFSVYFFYDSSVMTIESIEATEALANGDFIQN